MTTTDQARARLHSPLGGAGSAWLRYASAMSLWQAGEISPEALEIYRICATLDWEDPAMLLAERGLSVPPAPERRPPEARLRELVDEADRYLAGLYGPGIAEVRRSLAEARSGPCRPRPARGNAVVARHLPAALAALADDDPALAGAIAAAAPDLGWITYDAYPPGAMDPAFVAGHAFASLVGADAPLAAGDFDFGLFLIAPDVLYRDHRHAAPELYVPLTGPHGWRFGPGAPLMVKPAHQPVWNEPWAPHLTRTGAVPFLCLYAWTRDAQSEAEMVPATDWAALAAVEIA